MSVYRFAGDWNNIVTYSPNFVVVSNGLAYVAKETVTGGGEPSTNLAQWEYIPGGSAATFPIVDGDVSLTVDGTSNLIISAGAANVQVPSSLLVSGLFNNAGNDPPPNSGDVLKWNGAHVEWFPSAPSSTSFKQDAGSLTWTSIATTSSYYAVVPVEAYGTTTVSSNAAPQVTMGAINSAVPPTAVDAGHWVDCWIANSYAFNDPANSNAYSLYVTAAANPTGFSNVLMNVFLPNP